MSKRKGEFCECCGNKSQKIEERTIISKEIAEIILSYYTSSDVLIDYKEYISLINISKSFKLAIERIIKEFICEKEYYFICTIQNKTKSMIMDYYTYLRNVRAILNVVKTRETKYDLMAAKEKSRVLIKNDDFKKMLDKVNSEINLINFLSEYYGYYGRYFLYKKDGIIHKKLRIYGSGNKMYMSSLLNITHLPINQIGDRRLIFERIFDSSAKNEEIRKFEEYSYTCYLSECDTFPQRVLTSIQKEMEKYPLIKEFLAAFNSVIAGSWTLYHVLEKPKNWSPNDMDIYCNHEYRERIEEFLLCNNIKTEFFLEIHTLFIKV